MEGDQLEAELKIVITDANVLIDYLATDRRILKLIAGLFKEVFIPEDVLDEVKQITAKQITACGFTVYYPDPETYYMAANTENGLSFEDNICIIDSKRFGWGIVTNDTKMRSKCEEEGVELFWGLQLMVILVEKGRLTKEAAIKAGEKISGSNARITAKNLKEFINKINAVKI
jgi:rRNA-processing protein FCF1